MQKQVAFLRAINVSGKNSIKMDDLRSVFTELGCTTCTTYLQSGNVVFSSSRAITSESIEKAILRKLNVSCKVLILPESKITSIIKNNPFIKKGFDAAFCHVTMLNTPLTRQTIDKADAAKTPEEAYFIADTSIYLYCPHGYGNSKLSNAQWEKWCAATGTTRNWKTMCAVHELLQQ